MMNNKSIYAFSDRLVEYLLLNAIDYQEEIDKNIVRVQRKADILANTAVQEGVFDKATRMRLFVKYMTKHSDMAYDINGFVDKDMEKFIMEELK